LAEDLIDAHMETLFPGMELKRSHRFRVTRDADIEIRKKKLRNLLSVIQEELRQRRFGAPVRLEVSHDMPWK
jgi:polyphosphate kinase